MTESSRVNALSTETSPYLQQHAHNPVDWYPWGDAALERARRENKPILLSVGYSACHWCHVMAHESFEDEATAQVMNQLFVNIKVDREERPDIDKIYQTAQHLLTRRTGGWPLTMFLSPEDHAPFFGGTYFPDTPRFGMPSFKEILQRVAEFFDQHQEDIRQQNHSLIEALHSLEPSPGEDEIIGPRPISDAVSMLRRSFDTDHGGFGPAPKFPHPTNLERLLRSYAMSAIEGQADEAARDVAVFTLRKMALGGIYDQLGGGFCRYSVDDQWMIPHFEKMLYDNGPLLSLCAEAWQITRDPLFSRVARETAQWVMREMQSPEGGYYSSLDADSEGVEGKFYVWTPEEVRTIVDAEEYRLFSTHYGLDRDPNFEGELWHLHVFRELSALTAEFGESEAQLRKRLDSARSKLVEVRSKRIWPGRDEKVLTSWNALMIKGMAVAGQLLDEPDFIASAERALDFLAERMWHERRLYATYKDGRAHLNAYLDDYAFLIDAILTLLREHWDPSRLGFAVELAEVILEQFEDSQHGGFYFTANDHETLIHRSKPFGDDALPAGNGAAAYVLQRLGHLIGEPRYTDAGQRAIRAGWEGIAKIPHGHTTMLLAVEEYVYPPQTIVLRGTGSELDSWSSRCRLAYAPARMTVAIPRDAENLPGLLAARTGIADPVAYVCEGQRCEAPVTDFQTLEATLAATEVGA